MKHFLPFVLLFLTDISYGQQKGGHKVPPPVYFVDSVRYTALPVFDPQKIQSIDIVKGQDTASHTSGRVYIKTKNPKDLHFLSLAQVAQQQAPGGGPYLFMIDNEFIKDTTGCKIDSAYILRCLKIPSKEVQYFAAFRQAKDCERKVYSLFALRFQLSGVPDLSLRSR
jgi:hypothetical protein